MENQGLLTRAVRGDLVVVGHVHLQPKRGGVLRIAGDQLVVIAVLEEVEGVARVVVDELHVSVGHGQLAEFQHASRVIHVVGGGRIRRLQRGQPAGTESLNDAVAFDATD